MNALILGSLLFSMEYSCQSTEINETDVCPLTEEQWKTKEADIKCGAGEGYFCSLNENNAFITGCLPPHPIAPGTVGCPFVVTATQTLVHVGAYTPCNATFVGCPPKDHPGYTIAQLYKYPSCLLQPEERKGDFSVLDETTTERNTATSSHPIKSDKGNKGDLSTAGIVGISAAVIVIVAVLIGVVVFAVWRKRRKKKRGKISNVVIADDVQEQIELLPVKDSRPENVIDAPSTAHTDAEHLLPRPSSPKIIEEVNKDKEDEEESEGEDEEEVDEGEDGNEEEKKEEVHVQPNESMHQNTELSIFKKCCKYAEEGSEEALKQALDDQIKENASQISASDLKNVISLWVKTQDKPDVLESAVNLLSMLNADCCFETLELKPEGYDTPIAMLLYAGRMRKEKTVKYLLQRLKCIDHEDKELKTILHYCVLMDSKNLAEEVIEKNNSLINKRNIDGITAFNLAFTLPKLDIAEFLLEKGAIAHDENYKYETVVEKCLSHQWPNLLRKVLMSMQINTTSVSDLGKVFRVLLSPYKEDNLYAIKEALGLFPDMLSNSDYYLNNHPLIWVMKVNPTKPSPGPFILEKMSKDELFIVEDSDGFSALHVAIKHRSLVRLILKRDEDNFLLNKVDREDNTPIMYAVNCNKKSYINVLLRQPNINITNTNCERENVLHLVVRKNWFDQCKEILQGEDRNGQRILNESVRSTLLKGQDKFGMTPLMYAVKNYRSIYLLQLLLDEGSELLQMDRKHKTVFHHLVDKYSMDEKTKWAEWTRALMKSTKYRTPSYLFKAKGRSGQSLTDIALSKGCLDLLRTLDAEVLTEQSRQG